MVLTDVLTPILFVVLLGFLLRLLGRVDEGVFARAQLYVLSPALVFSAMARAEAGTVLVFRVLLFVAFLSVLVLGVSQGVSLAVRASRSERFAMSLTSVFMNSGFYGIPVCMLAFGETGLVYATIFVVASASIQSTLGVYIANAGSQNRIRAFYAIFKVPLIYAIVLSRLLVHFEALPPEPLMKMINLLGQSAIPLGLLLLGMQIERLAFSGRGAGARRGAAMRRREVADAVSELAAGYGVERPRGEGDGSHREEEIPASDRGAGGGRREAVLGIAAGTLRICCGFAFALLLVRFFDFEPALEKVIIVEASMPTAVNTVALATEFGSLPRLVATGILFSTLLSVATVTLILMYVV